MADGAALATKDACSTDPTLVAHHAEVDFALVVGVDDYPDFRSLQGAVADARRFHEWVCAPEGGGVDEANARLIQSSSNPITPIQDQIDDALLELMQKANGLGGGRRLYFYFSGHGATDPGEPADNVALLLARWSQHRARFALSSRDYSTRLNDSGVFEELAVFLDCCRSIGVGAVGLPPQITFNKTDQRCATRTFIAYATEPGRSAYERRVADRWEGVFTRRLLTILQEEPAGITASLLKDRLELTPYGATDQRARVQHDFLGDAMFGKRGALPRLHVTFRAGRARVRLRDGKRRVIAEHDAGSGPWQVALPFGLYALEDDTPEKLMIDHGLGEVTRVDF